MSRPEDRTLFPYVGKKANILKYYPRTPDPKKLQRANRIVEPFAGAMSFSARMFFLREDAKCVGKLVQPLQIVGYDVSEELLSIYKYLASLHKSGNMSNSLLELDFKIRQNAGQDIRQLLLSPGEQSLARLCSCGVYRGQFSSWKTTNVRKSVVGGSGIPIDKILKNSAWLACAEFYLSSATSCLDRECARDIIFLDPPYQGTSANYDNKKEDSSSILPEVDIILKHSKSPIIFTYGDGALDRWPTLNWHEALIRKVPIIRGGGTKLRTEYVAYVNW